MKESEKGELFNRIADFLRIGRSPQEAAEMFGVTLNRVYYIRRKSGIPVVDFRFAKKGKRVQATTKYQRRRHKLIDAGLCRICGKKPEGNFSLCDSCRLKRTVLTRNYLTRKKRRLGFSPKIPRLKMIDLKSIASAIKPPMKVGKLIEIAVGEWLERNNRALKGEDKKPSKLAIQAAELEIALHKKLGRNNHAGDH